MGHVQGLDVGVLEHLEKKLSSSQECVLDLMESTLINIRKQSIFSPSPIRPTGDRRIFGEAGCKWTFRTPTGPLEPPAEGNVHTLCTNVRHNSEKQQVGTFSPELTAKDRSRSTLTWLLVGYLKPADLNSMFPSMDGCTVQAKKSIQLIRLGLVAQSPLTSLSPAAPVESILGCLSSSLNILAAAKTALL